MYTCVCIYMYLPAHFSIFDLIYLLRGSIFLIKIWKKYHLKGIKEMKVGNYIINIFTALPNKILICVLSKILGEHTHTEMSNTLSLCLCMIWSTSPLPMWKSVFPFCVLMLIIRFLQICCASVSCQRGVRLLSVGVSIPQCCGQNWFYVHKPTFYKLTLKDISK